MVSDTKYNAWLSVFGILEVLVVGFLNQFCTLYILIDIEMLKTDELSSIKSVFYK
jgi:hypothetical protein